MSSGHGVSKPAGIDFVARSRFHHGRFGRLFPNLDPATYGETGEQGEEALQALAETMVDESEPTESGNGKGGGWSSNPAKPDLGDNPGIPAGYTYLGQFVDHDITFDPASSLLRSNDPNALHNFRTPRFDLDNVYGEGPDDEPFLYAKPPENEERSGRMLIGAVEGSDELDLPRNSEGVALIGDMRNDENVVVSQLQLQFLRAHNKLIDAVEPPPGVTRFDEARRQLRWHYQHIVVNDFLGRIVHEDVLKKVLPDGGPAEWCKHCHCHFGHELPYMPVEFSVAAYRFGHSMVRPQYNVNDVILDRPIFAPGSQRGDGQDLRGFQPLLSQWTVDWSLFFELDPNERPQSSRLIDTLLAKGLASLPETKPPSLAFRNLQRGVALGLPWGEAVAKALGEDPLTTAEVGLADLGLDEKWLPTFAGRTPLWFYILREAKVRNDGLQLGPVGGWIVAQTLICLLAGDHFSYVNIDPNWKPDPGLIPHEGEFEMADLIRFATS